MSSNQTLILNAIQTRITALGLSRTKLDYSYDLEKNSKRSEKSAYGFGAGSAEWEQGTHRTVTLNQSFFVVLTENYVNRSDDSKEDTAIKAIYDDIETIFLDFASSKLGIAATVLVVESLSLDEPIKISENTISVKANFIVKHRKTTT